jgi:hypothetical protein
MKHVGTLALATAAVVASALVSGMAGAPTAAATAAARPIEAGAPAGMWQPLSADPLPFYPQATMVLTDGSVMLQEVTSDVWWRLRPDARGNYLHGTYTRTPPMPGGYAPTYECRAVLPDGRLLIIGGEYQGTGTVPVESNQGAVYDPVANSWQPLAPPPGVSHIGDSSCTMMPNGRLLLASRSGGNVFELDPASMTWTAHTPLGKLNGTNSEENWTLLPDGTIFTVDVARAGNAERYIPPWLDHSTDGRWVSAGAVPAQMEVGFEMGPAVLRPDGSVLALGANGQNAIYRPPATLYGTGTWTTAEPFADSAGTSYGMADGTASLLPDGSVVALASPGVYQRPTMEFRIAGADAAPLDPQLPTSVNSQISSYSPDSVLLPSGQVLVTLIGGGDEPLVPPYVFTPSGLADPSWRPTIAANDLPRHVTAGQTITLSGTQLSGLSQGSNYGDDGDSATNFPVVRIVNQLTHRVEYARTFGFSEQVAAGPQVLASTQVALPADLDRGPAQLVVVANGIASAPQGLLVG